MADFGLKYSPDMLGISTPDITKLNFQNLLDRSRMLEEIGRLHPDVLLPPGAKKPGGFLGGIGDIFKELATPQGALALGRMAQATSYPNTWQYQVSGALNAMLENQLYSELLSRLLGGKNPKISSPKKAGTLDLEKSALSPERLTQALQSYLAERELGERERANLANELLASAGLGIRAMGTETPEQMLQRQLLVTEAGKRREADRWISWGSDEVKGVQYFKNVRTGDIVERPMVRRAPSGGVSGEVARVNLVNQARLDKMFAKVSKRLESEEEMSPADIAGLIFQDPYTGRVRTERLVAKMNDDELKEWNRLGISLAKKMGYDPTYFKAIEEEYETAPPADISGWTKRIKERKGK